EAFAQMVRPRAFQVTTWIEVRAPGGGPAFAVTTDASLEMVQRVAAGEVDLAVLNPSAALTAAYLGKGPFSAPLPVRAVTVLPSPDWFFIAVTEASGLTSLAEVKDRKYPLRVSVAAGRGIRNFYAREVLGSSGLSPE